jgi:hypothetical protein
MTADGIRFDYTKEYGTLGKALVLPSSGTQFRFVRLGTLSVPIGSQATHTVYLTGSVAVGSTGQFGVDYLVFCLASARALSPTGKVNDATYPAFAPYNGISKVVQPDLRGSKDLGSGLAPSLLKDVGLGGSLLEVPNTNVDLLVKLCSLVPDDPTLNATSEALSHPATVRLADVRPRWRLSRSS